MLSNSNRFFCSNELLTFKYAFVYLLIQCSSTFRSNKGCEAGGVGSGKLWLPLDLWLLRGWPLSFTPGCSVLEMNLPGEAAGPGSCFSGSGDPFLPRFFAIPHSLNCPCTEKALHSPWPLDTETPLWAITSSSIISHVVTLFPVPVLTLAASQLSKKKKKRN